MIWIIGYIVIGLIVGSLVGISLRNVSRLGSDVIMVSIIQFAAMVFWPIVAIGYLMWKSTDLAQFLLKSLLTR